MGWLALGHLCDIHRPDVAHVSVYIYTTVQYYFIGESFAVFMSKGWLDARAACSGHVFVQLT